MRERENCSDQISWLSELLLLETTGSAKLPMVFPKGWRVGVILIFSCDLVYVILDILISIVQKLPGGVQDVPYTLSYTSSALYYLFVFLRGLL